MRPHPDSRKNPRLKCLNGKLVVLQQSKRIRKPEKDSPGILLNKNKNKR